MANNTELITVKDNAPELNADVAAQIAYFERQMKFFKAQEDLLKTAILNEMEAKGIKKIDTDQLSVIYIAATDRERFDTAQFREAHADLYDDYIKMQRVKPSIRIKVK